MLPTKDSSNLAVLTYLSTVRKLPYRLVTGLITGGLLYQDQRKNAVFLCRDRAGQVKGAVLRGTDRRAPFKGMAPGSDSTYGWLWVPDREPSCKGVVVTEAPIDAISVEAIVFSSPAALGAREAGEIVRKACSRGLVERKPPMGEALPKS